MAVEFLTDEQAARYGSFHERPSRAELERYFFLDDADREAVQAKRRAHNRLGLAVQLTSMRLLGRFMPDQTYLRLATYRAANATLIEHQASIGLAQAWGGGLVASVDGMRFVVPVPSESE